MLSEPSIAANRLTPFRQGTPGPPPTQPSLSSFRQCTPGPAPPTLQVSGSTLMQENLGLLLSQKDFYNILVYEEGYKQKSKVQYRYDKYY